MSEAPSHLLPFCRNFLIADFVHQDPLHGKVTVLGTFNQVTCLRQQDRRLHVAFGVYIELTGIHHPADVDFAIVRPDNENREDDVILTVPVARGLRAHSPIHAAELVNRGSLVPFEHPGAYRALVVANGMEIASRHLLVNEATPQGGP